jgi:hypothetical protein
VAEIAISYAHADSSAAREVRRHLVDLGYTVWMDESGEDRAEVDAIGIPVGQAHWDVIAAEFRSAHVVVVLDTAHWEASAYCRREFDFCRAEGKWVHRLSSPDDDLAALSGEIAARARYVGAHARLLQRIPLEGGAAGPAVASGASGAPSTAGFWRANADAADAAIVLGGTPADNGVRLTEALVDYATHALEHAHRVRRRLTRLATGVVAALAALALVAGFAWAFSGLASADAARSAAAAESRRLAAASESAAGTLDARRLADQAVELSSNPASRQAAALAATRQARSTVVEVEPRTYLGGSWAADSDVVVLYSIDTLVPVDLARGSSGPAVPVGRSIMAGSPVVSAAGDRVVVLTRSGGRLLLVDLAKGTTADLGLSGVTALSTSDGGDLWYAQGATLFRAGFPDEGTVIATPGGTGSYHAGSGIRAVSVTDAGLIDLVTETGDLVSLRSDDSGALEPVGTLTITTEWTLDPDTVLAATVQRCGDSVYGNYLRSVRGLRFVTDPASGAVRTEQSVRETRPVCGWQDDAWSMTVARGFPESFTGAPAPLLPDGMRGAYPLDDPTRSRVGIVGADSRVVVYREHGAVTGVPVTGVWTVVPLPGKTLVVRQSGEVADLATGAVTGSLDGVVSPMTVAVDGCLAVVGTTSGLFTIDCGGTVAALEDERSADVGDRLRSVKATASGDGFVVALDDEIWMLDDTGAVVGAIDVPLDDDSDSLRDAELLPGGETVAVVTVLGSLFTVAVETGAVVARSDAPLAASNNLTLTADSEGAVFVLAADGILRRFDSDLRMTGRLALGSAASSLRSSGDRIVAGIWPATTVVVDSGSLTVVDRFSEGMLIAAPDPAVGAPSIGIALSSGFEGEDSVDGTVVFVPPAG